VHRSALLLRQDPFEPRVVSLNGDHRIINQLADGRLLRVVLQMLPTSFGGNPKDVLSLVLILIFRVGPFELAFTRDQLLMQFLKRVGDVV